MNKAREFLIENDINDVVLNETQYPGNPDNWVFVSDVLEQYLEQYITHKTSTTIPEYTYPRLLQNKVVWALWKRICCPRGWHLWDEVLSFTGPGGNNYLHCDACGAAVNVDRLTDVS